METNERKIQEIIDAGPDAPAPTAGRKNIPVPIMEFIVINKIAGKLSTFFNSAILFVY